MILTRDYSYVAELKCSCGQWWWKLEGVIGRNGALLIISNTMFEHRVTHECTWYQNTVDQRWMIDFLVISLNLLPNFLDVREKRGVDVSTAHHLVVSWIRWGRLLYRGSLIYPNTKRSKNSFIDPHVLIVSSTLTNLPMGRTTVKVEVYCCKNTVTSTLTISNEISKKTIIQLSNSEKCEILHQATNLGSSLVQKHATRKP